MIHSSPASERSHCCSGLSLRPYIPTGLPGSSYSYILYSLLFVSLYINSCIFSQFSALFCMTTLSAGTTTSISMHVFSFLFLVITAGLLAVTSLCVLTHSVRMLHLHVHILVCICVCVREPQFCCFDAQCFAY